MTADGMSDVLLPWHCEDAWAVAGKLNGETEDRHPLKGRSPDAVDLREFLAVR